MKYIELRDHLKHKIIFTPNDVRLFEPDFRLDRLSEWQDKGYITNITRGFYLFSEYKQQSSEQLLYLIANEIYAPSYVSFESALSHHNMIPEGVYTTISASTRKSAELQTPCGTFRYHTLKPSMMVGYELIDYHQYKIRMATKEKALVDYLYIHNELDNKAAIHELRINPLEIENNFNREEFWKWVRIAENNALEDRAHLFLDYYQNPSYAQY
jgi:predicted transcriptional regulator of viral defense system